MTEAIEASLEEQLTTLDQQDLEADAFYLPEGAEVAPPPTFHKAFPIRRVKPASYNPRFLSEESFKRLQESLARFGVVKPVILNLNDTIIAGHQRTKALTAIGAEHCPAIQLAVTINTTDEIRFNLLHNSIEENGASCYGPRDMAEGYHWIDPAKFLVADVGRAAVRVAQCYRLLAVYGTWGSVVIDPKSGKVILNSDYAVACAQLRLPILAYYPAAELVQPLREALGGEYGIYDSSQVQDKPYLQNVVQPNRLRETFKGEIGYKSRVWETLALPRMNKTTRVLDFGAGKCDYVRHLTEGGYDVRAYEPFFTTDAGNGLAIDIAAVVKMIVRLNREVRRNGLFDVVVLDSVLNATSTDDYHDAVITTCAALVKPGGVLVTGTRSLARQEDQASSKQAKGAGAPLTYLDPRTNREINFMLGQFFTMKYHTPESLADELRKRFATVVVEDTRNATLLAVCSESRPISEADLRVALETEFDMPYPEGYRHGKQGPLVEAIIEANRDAGRLA